MAQCPACGTQASGKFCPTCGAQVPQQSAASAMPTPPPMPPQQGQTPVQPPYPPQQAPYPPQQGYPQGYAPQQGMYPGMAPQPVRRSGGWIKWVLGGVGVLTLLVLALIFLGGSTPGIGEVVINTTETFEHMSVIPAQAEEIIAIAEVTTEEAVVATAKWYVDGEHITQLDRDVDVPANIEDYLTFRIWRETMDRWPAANYKVEIYVDGAKQAEQTFKVN